MRQDVAEDNESDRQRRGKWNRALLAADDAIIYAYMRMQRSEAFEVGGLPRVFKALGDETRLRIVALLAHGELCVCHLEQALGISQPNASQHLSVLRAAGVVAHRRVGTWVHYRLAPQADADCQAILRALVRAFGRRDLLRRDVARLTKAKRPGPCR